MMGVAEGGGVFVKLTLISLVDPRGGEREKNIWEWLPGVV